MKPVLQVSSLFKQYADVCAVDMVSFEAGKGDVIALLGPNGAGKSTLMNIIAGFLTSDGGSISICGKDIRQFPQTAKENTGFLAEGTPMYGDMRVRAFLDYMSDLKGLSGNNKRIRLQSVMEMAQINKVADFKIEQLSKGYRRRVGFAQSILSDPPLLLLDEPTDGLDPNQKDHIRKLIKNMGATKTVIISTHLLDDVEEMCNRIMVMNRGRIIADGSKEEIFETAKSCSLATAFRKLTGGTNA